MFMEFHKNPKKGEVYNVGGGRENSTSVLEAIELIESVSGKSATVEYLEENRIGDHKWYITNNNKFQTHYPNWKSNYNLDRIIKDLIGGVRL